jgi:V8-like Glu-specific endopeptidase
MVHLVRIIILGATFFLGTTEATKREKKSPKKRIPSIRSDRSKSINPETAQKTKSLREKDVFAKADNILPFLDPSTSRIFGAPVSLGNSTDDENFDRAGRIVGGNDALPTEAPFFTLLLTYDKVKGTWRNLGCGGALISDRHILTAAHCVKGRDGSNDAVIVSAYFPFKGDSRYPFHFSKVLQIDVHPNFNDISNVNDVAIITFERTVQNLTRFPPVRLLSPQQTIDEGENSKIYGFGQTVPNVTTSIDTLQVVNIPYIPFAKCARWYPWSLQPDMICAGQTNSNRDACAGDSGGPMTIQQDGVVYQVGVVSWGEGRCGQTRKPGVYSSVQYHYEWLRRNVCASDDIPDSIELCQSTTKTNTVPPAVIIGRKSDSCVPGKPEGRSCSYGGECCSGICGIPSSYYNTRVCLRERTSNNGNQRRGLRHRN